MQHAQSAPKTRKQTHGKRAPKPPRPAVESVVTLDDLWLILKAECFQDFDGVTEKQFADAIRTMH